MPEQKLSQLGGKILEKIVTEKIGEISYYHPKIQLGKELAKNYDQTIEVLRSFEYKFRIIKLTPTLKFKRPILLFSIHTKCGYEVHQNLARELYNSIKAETQE